MRARDDDMTSGDGSGGAGRRRAVRARTERGASDRGADDRRETPRLTLSYPIRLLRDADGDSVLGHTVTRDVSSTGAYFTTFDVRTFRRGQRVKVVLSVPHRPSSAGREVVLDLRGSGEIIRVDGPHAHRRFGEDGLCLAGIAVAFDKPLSFRYAWV